MRINYPGARRWYDSAKATSYPLRDGTVLDLTASGEWATRQSPDADTAEHVTPEQARRLLAANGLDAAIVDRAAPAEQSRRNEPGRPEIGPRITLPIPQDVIDALDTEARERIVGVTRADVIRDALHDRAVMIKDGSAAWLRGRDDRHLHAPGVGGAPREIRLFRQVLASAQREAGFAVAELCCLADVMNGSIMLEGFGQLAAHEFGDADDSYAAKWGVDRPALLARLWELSPLGDYALRDGIARFWGASTLDDADEGTWRDLGFRVTGGLSAHD